MSFEKKVILLKQLEKGFSTTGKAVSGIARIETENGVAEFFLSLINLSKKRAGEFFAFVLDACGKLFAFPLSGSPDFLVKIFPSLPASKTISVGIVFVDNYIPFTILFGTTNNSTDELILFKKAVADYFSCKYKEDLLSRRKDSPPQKAPISEPFPEPSPIKPPYPPTPSPDPTKTPPDEFKENCIDSNPYNDEAVATENYYDFREIENKLNLIMERDNGNLQPKNELPHSGRKSQTQERSTENRCIKDETNESASTKYSKEAPYYLSVREELEKIFSNFPAEENLVKLFIGSRWAKVFYSGDKHYVVGIIPENGTEKYVCYGVPAIYSKEPPKELKGFCSFIPLSIFALEGSGYWMMFQDAVSGECIKPN